MTEMNSRQNNIFKEDDVFDDSSFLAKFEESSLCENKNQSHIKSNLNVSALCCDEELSGYDKLTGRTWIYPTNYPVRDYQFNIIKAAILKNTLVSLPTGLGKTFIAAVIMYNFYRWYPLGKIVFTAPTRPLVAQQIDACYNIIAIPPNDTIEMTGHMQVATRKLHWQSKRVFFATPQVIFNDIQSGICPSDKIKCLVIDEAHRARGNYAYCQIVSTLTELGHKTFRILALSATPGSKVEDVINVVRSLHITHLELRTENCIDVAQYSHSRKINTVVIPLGPMLTELRRQYVEILDEYARRLKQLNILPHNLGNLSKGRVVMLYKEFQSRERGSRHPQHNFIMKDFTLLIALYHGLELLVKHGSRVFLNFFDEHPEKSWIQSDDKLTALLERLRDDLGVNPMSLDTSILPDGTMPQIPKNLTFGHPKFDRLKEIMLEHFNRAKHKGQDTRAIVFCEYRESVNLVHRLLLQCRPLISAQMFVGQGASGKDGKAVTSQKQQLRVMRQFREGACNTLVATCVAEEGLDVGSVDLIICFDISTRSPVRLVQRCGRTGRERGGQVFILVTEGREHQTLIDCMRQRDGLNQKIMQSKEVENNLYKLNPRMIPHDFVPECQKMYITVTKKNDPKDKTARGVEKGQKDLRNMFLGRTSSSGSSFTNIIESESGSITKEDFQFFFPNGYSVSKYFAKPKEYCTMSKDEFQETCKVDQGQFKLATWLEWQRSLQKTVNIEHSSDSKILTTLLQYSDAKRFELPPSTQKPTFSNQEVVSSPIKSKPAKKQKNPIIKSPRKGGDIRALFSTATKSTKNYTKLINDLGIPNDGSISTSLISLFVDLSLQNTDSISRKICYICQNICQCSLFTNIRTYRQKQSTSLTFLNEPKLPDIDLIGEITPESIQDCVKLFENQKEDTLSNVGENANDPKLQRQLNNTSNFDLDFNLDSPIDVNSLEDQEGGVEKIIDFSEKNFDIGEIDDLFGDSSPEEFVEKNVIEPKNSKINSSDPKQALGFFGLDSIDDIFADSCDEAETDKVCKEPPCVSKEPLNNNFVKSRNQSQEYRAPSPSILSGRPNINVEIPTSPILCSQVRKVQLSTKKSRLQNFTSSTPQNNVKQQILDRSIENLNNNATKHQAKSDSTNSVGVVDTTNRSMLTITQLVEIINKTNETSLHSESNSLKELPPHSKTKDNFIEDIERNPSPILLTQAERKTMSENKGNLLPKESRSIIILESDSDSDNTQSYDLKDIKIDATSIETQKKNSLSPQSGKRKLTFDENDALTASPYFNKKQKIENNVQKPLTLQEKVLAALSSNKFNNNNTHEFNVNYLMSSPKFSSQKENKNPLLLHTSDDEKEFECTYLSALKNNKQNHRFHDASNVLSNCTENKVISHDLEDSVQGNIKQLQLFKRDKSIDNTKKVLRNNSKNSLLSTQKHELTFADSDDDFVNCDKNKFRSPTQMSDDDRNISVEANHKVRKKKRKRNQFLDLEAELSEVDGSDSGDEMSDDSIGSVADFIDDNVTHDKDIYGHYLRSIKSPVKGTFKIPQLPQPSRYNKIDVLSQFVEDDSYQLDSFCVDSHIGLTQVNDMSELEIAEQALEDRRTKRKRNGRVCLSQDSPVIGRNYKKVKRRIESDSDDSS